MNDVTWRTSTTMCITMLWLVLIEAVSDIAVLLYFFIALKKRFCNWVLFGRY